MDLKKYYGLVEESEFIQRLNELEKKSNRSMWSRKDLQNAVRYFHEIEAGEKKEPHHYYYEKNYELMKIGREVHVCVKRNPKTDKLIYVVGLEDCYEKVLESHIKSGHGGRDRAYYYACEKWRIPKTAFQLFASMCKSCNLKKSKVQISITFSETLLADLFLKGLSCKNFVAWS